MLTSLVLSAALLGLAHATLVDLNTTQSDGVTILETKTFETTLTPANKIVVGGGTAGLTIARRLAESSLKTSVLVLEAGGSGVGLNVVTIPEKSFSFVGTDIDWGFTIAPQEHAGEYEINLSSGKILGGDSAVNGLVWTRASKAEYDAFETLGSPGWNWDTLYAHMRKAEQLEYPSASLIDEYGYVVDASSLGESGPVSVSFPAYLPIQHKTLVEASVELGHTFNTDAYSGDNAGVYYSLSSQNTVPVRETSEFAYLTPWETHKQLTVFTYATVSKINLDDSSEPKATGVQVIFPDGSEYTASLKSGGEVILSAGVVRTPQLLELSGIGNSSILTPLGIDVKVELPGVGANYEDHTMALLTYQLKDGYLSFDALSYNETLLEEETELYSEGEGWLTFAQAVVNFEPIDVILTADEIEEAKEILSTKPESTPQDQFDILKELILNGTTQVEYLLFNSFSAGDDKESNTSYVSLSITHTHPLSRGSIHINSTSIDDFPVINPNMFEAEWDQWWLAKATAYGRKFFQTQAFQEIVVSEEVYPGSSVSTDDEWLEYVKENLNAGYHSAGTASLLPKESNGVVGANLTVYGTQNLRVVDLSILPMLISAHTQPAAYAIGELAATLITTGSTNC
ncbi:alcohol oxidase [Guyanagaster necrorhizus]|uniref:Alcohol oxidase n=1 Tax=Guyanagaster necrorhizus TaxID=856835 RepID=A0A9P7VYD6_9AGAR|nr:alcohol oxidase [Guyanagaster necrorhizus MCA 3950]KAG7448868.1 alcohol oxidase [Guyanagaster necrorhizus MCA 3950]